MRSMESGEFFVPLWISQMRFLHSGKAMAWYRAVLTSPDFIQRCNNRHVMPAVFLAGLLYLRGKISLNFDRVSLRNFAPASRDKPSVLHLLASRRRVCNMRAFHAHAQPVDPF